MTLNIAPAPEPSVLVLKTIGKFNFTVTRGMAPPADLPKPPSAHALPFKELYTDYVAAGERDEAWVPEAFWTSSKAEGGRELPKEGVTPQWQKGKLRAAFNEWVKADPTKREHFKFVTVYRKAGDDNGRFTEPGISWWIITEK